MKKHIKKGLLILSAAVAAVTAFSACSEHLHTFKEEWEHDSECHWHAPSCEHTDLWDAKAKHRYEEKVTKQATCSEEGSITYTCKDCAYSYTETVPTVAHIYAEDWTKDANGHWHACTVCGDKKDEAAHDDKETVTTAPTCEGEGEASYVCKVCGYEHTGKVPAAGHTFSKKWEYDETHHWHEATCEHTEEQGGKAEHVYAEQITKPATCTEKGEKTLTCVCGATKTEEIPAKGHNVDKTAWKKDSSKHWHECTICGDKQDEAEHNFVEGVCDACGADLSANPEMMFKFELSNNAYTVAGLTEHGVGVEILSIPATYQGKNVTAIKAYAFEENQTITSITIPATVASIGREAFRACANLETVTFEEGSRLASIAETAFGDCAKLTTLAIPSTVTSIGAYAFDHCAQLKSVTLPAGLTSLGDQAFNGCAQLKSVTLPANLTVLNDRVFMNCTQLATVTFNAALTRIGIAAFYNCAALTQITLPAGLEEIGTAAFAKSGLTSVVVPDSVERISVEAFADCANLLNATLPNGAFRYHFGRIFAGCEKLASLTIPFVGSNVSKNDAVEKEFGYLFGTYVKEAAEAKYDLAGIYYIPKSLKTVKVLGGTIAQGAFDGCASLETVTVEGTVVLEATSFTGFTAEIKVLGAPTLSDITLAAAGHTDEETDLTYTATYGSVITVSVKKGEADAVLDTDYSLNDAKTKITFKTAGTFTVTVTATLNEESASKTATIEVTVLGPAFTASLDKNAINQGETVTLTYEITRGTLKGEIVVKKGDAVAEVGADKDYTVSQGVYTFISFGEFTITLTVTHNGLDETKTFTVNVADTTVAAPTIDSFTSDAEGTVKEGAEVTLSYTATYDTAKDDSEKSHEYAVSVKKADGSYENAAADTYTVIGNQFKALIAGEYKIVLTVTSQKSQTATAELTVTATAVTVEELNLAWTTTADTNGWVRFANEGGDLVYTIADVYAGGYDVTYSAGDAVGVSASKATSGTGVTVSATASNTATITVTYTHKTNAELTTSIKLPVSFVSDLENSPVLGSDPFGGTYGTLIPSTGLMLYYDVRLNDEQVSAENVTYTVTDQTKLIDLKAGGKVTVEKVNGLDNQWFVLIEDFDGDNNKAHGELTLKVSVTVDGKTAAASKKFIVTAVGTNETSKVADYVKNVVVDGAFKDGKFIGDSGLRQNMIVSKTGIVHHRLGGWDLGGDAFRIDLNGENETNPLNQFQVDFKCTSLKGNNMELTFGFRTGTWNGWAGSLGFRPNWDGEDATKANEMQVQGWLKNPDNNDASGSFEKAHDKVITVGAGVMFYGRVTRTTEENGDVVYKAYFSTDGTTYNQLCSYNVGQSNTDGRAAKYVYALQLGFGGNNGYYLENLQITNLDA